MEQGRMNLVATTFTASDPSYLHLLTPSMAIDGSPHCKMVCYPSVALAAPWECVFPHVLEKIWRDSLCLLVFKLIQEALCGHILEFGKRYNPEDYKLSGKGGKR